VRAQYPLAAYPDAGAAFGQAVGDAILACPALRGAQALARHTRVYAYEFAHAPNPFVLPMPGIDLGAFHSAELPYVFAGPVQSSGAITFSPDEERLVEAVTSAWTRFAASGRPGAGWPRWTKRSAKHLVLDTPVSLGQRLKERECAFWDDLGWQPGGR
jgi:para-nitrobenzyl esterase